MDETTIRKLIALDNGFYCDNHASFSRTRGRAWDGWARVCETITATPASALDVACGNMRFKAFLDDYYGDAVDYQGIDSCSDLVPENQTGHFKKLDIIEGLMDNSLSRHIGPTYDLIACFGFMHHVPSIELRAKLLDILIDKTSQGGTIALSFWQFAQDEKSREKANRTTERGCEELGLVLDAGDYLLGWNDKARAYRYCHSFTDEEINQLASHCDHRVHIADCFKADGRTGEMNGYLVLRKLV